MKKNRGIQTTGMLVLAGIFLSLPFFRSLPVCAAAPAEPVFDKESGEYEEGFELTLSAPSGCTIYYTTDGSIPLAKEDAGKTAATETKTQAAAADEKMDTLTYTKPISVKNRAGEENILASKTNAPLMYNTEKVAAYVPKAEDVAKATVIRALSVDAQGNRSKVVTKTYFVGNHLSETYKNAAVMSIVTDPDNLMSAETGIYRKENYANSGKEWERPAYVEYFEEDGSIPFSTDMGIRIHGGWSRHYGQKSFNLYFREEYGGLKSLKDYSLIPGATDVDGQTITKYKSVMLRNGGNDTEYTKLQDVWIQNLVKDRNITTQASRPCVLFLNGEYWGVYNLTEKYSDNFIAEKFHVNKDNVIVIKDDAIDEGKDEDITYYNQLQNFAKLDMTDSENYDNFCKLVDLSSYIDYYAVETYIGNYDWPEKNTACWRTRENDGSSYGDTKWRWMLYDTEYSMELYGHKTGTYPLKWVLRKDKLFASVFKNESFQRQFAKTMLTLADNNFEVASATASLNEYASVYKTLMQDYFKRFGLDSANFTRNVSRIKTFLKGREKTILADLKKNTNADLDELEKEIAEEKAKEEENQENTENQESNGNTDVSSSAVDSNDGAAGTSSVKVYKPAKVTKLKLLAQKKKTVTFSWKKIKNVKGYEIIIAADKKFKKQKRTLTAVKTKKTITGLKKKKHYYVRVRAYRKKTNGKKVYGSWSTKVSFVCK